MIPNTRASCSDFLWSLRCLGAAQTVSRRNIIDSSDSSSSSNPASGVIAAIVVVLVIGICLAVVRRVRGSSARRRACYVNGVAGDSGGVVAPSLHQAYRQMQLNRSHWTDPNQPLPSYNTHNSEDQTTQAMYQRPPSPLPLYVPPESPIAPPPAILSETPADVSRQQVPLYTPSDHPLTTPSESVQAQNTSTSLPSVPPPAYTPL